MAEMNFELIRDAIETLFLNYAAGEFRTIGAQTRAQSAEEVQDKNRSVEVYYSSGDFPKSRGSLSGPMMHEMTFKIDLAASKASEVDLATLENPVSTPEEKALALSALKEARRLADRSLDELWRLVWQILMAASSIDLEMEDKKIGSRWLNNFRKDPPTNYGDLVVVTATADFTCNFEEETTGLIPTTPDPVEIDGTLQVTGDIDTGVMDETGKAGVLVENPA